MWLTVLKSVLVGFPISCQPVTGLRVRILGARPSLGLLLGVPGSSFAPPRLPRALAEAVTLGQGDIILGPCNPCDPPI